MDAVGLIRFSIRNARWIGGGIVLTFFSSVGQTFFIAQFAVPVREGFGLGHGGFGLLYMGATLASAVTLVFIGRVVDVVPVRTVASAVVVALALAAFTMASSHHVAVLAFALYLLRLFGQGMMSHVAMTAMGRWFMVERGRAVSLVALGHQLGEAVLPLAVVAALAWLEWRTVWILSGVAVLALALPLVRLAFATGRTPRHAAAGVERDACAVRQWRCGEVLRDPVFWIVCTGVLAPAFIGTSVFFHQVHLATIKGWAPEVVASSFVAMAITNVAFALVTGQAIDRWDAHRLLALFPVPLGAACFVLASAQAPSGMIVFMLLIGASSGASASIFGAIWAEVYGTLHLGAVRSVVFAAMVLASALGPGITGALIDAGIGLERQLEVMGLYCAVATLVMIPVSRALHARLRAFADAPANAAHGAPSLTSHR